MNILILGGTRFVGRAIVESALSSGHKVTLFNRGKSNPDLFSDVETLTGDRDGGLDSLKGKRWDIAIDTCGYVPRIVNQSAMLLKDAVERYVFISTISVYDSGHDGATEEHPLATIADKTIEEVNAKTYGALKVLCEEEVERHFAGRSLHIRPGVVVGPHDPTDRFTYWTLKAAQSAEALAPNPPERLMQFIDARDLGDWVIAGCEAQRTGVFNAVGPEKRLTMADFLSVCSDVARTHAGSATDFVWLDEEFLIEHGAHFWSELPLCVRPKDGKTVSMNFRSDKARAAGLTFRPLVETVTDTFTWARQRPANYQLRAGLSQDKERELLSAWLQEQKSEGTIQS